MSAFSMREYSAGLLPDKAPDQPSNSKRMPNGKAVPGCLIAVKASAVTMRDIEWVWPGRVAVGKHTAFAGEPGVGKSTLLLDIAAVVTRGGEWPCEEGRAPKGSVVILSAEDDAADTIVPRFLAAGGDPDKLHIISAVMDDSGVRTFNLQADLTQLEAKIAAIGDVRLAIIDPISSYMGKTDSHKNSETRGVIEPLSEMASRKRIAILSNTHFSKTGAANKSSAMHRFIGSIAFIGAPRAAFAIVKDPDDGRRRLLLNVKTNIGAVPQGLAYSLEQSLAGYIDDGCGGHKPLFNSRVVWADEPVEVTADQAIRASEATIGGGAKERDAPERSEAEEFLRELLAEGPMLKKDVEVAAREVGVTLKTLRNAKERLRVKSVSKRGEDGRKIVGWEWALPKDDTTEDSDE